MDCPAARRFARSFAHRSPVAIPNFFFHATTAYAILRHNGVHLGKMDFIGTIPVKEG